MSDEEIVRALYDTLATGDRKGAERLYAPEAKWVPDPRTGQSVRKGRNAVVNFLIERAEMFDRVQIDIESIESAAGRVLAMIRITGEGSGSGAPVAIRIGHVWEVRDSLLIRGQGFGDRDEAEREFRS